MDATYTKNPVTPEEAELALREASKSWSAAEWEYYLQTLEGGLTESQPASHEVSRSAIAANAFELLGPSSSEEIDELVCRLLKGLGAKQKFVIEKYFFEGLSNSEIARMMSVSRQRVFSLKKKALRQLKFKARVLVGKFPIVEAQTSETQKVVRASDAKGELSC